MGHWGHLGVDYGPHFRSGGAANDDCDAGRGCLDGIAAARSATRLPTGVGGVEMGSAGSLHPAGKTTTRPKRRQRVEFAAAVAAAVGGLVASLCLSVCVWCPSLATGPAQVQGYCRHQTPGTCNTNAATSSAIAEPHFERRPMDGAATGLDLVLGSWALPCATLGNVRGRGRGLDSCARFTPSQGQAC